MIENLPEDDRPAFFGLPANIERSSQRIISSQVTPQAKHTHTHTVDSREQTHTHTHTHTHICRGPPPFSLAHCCLGCDLSLFSLPTLGSFTVHKHTQIAHTHTLTHTHTDT